ncbi:AsmA-like C-terminal domain-containing protein [Kordiimonas marina]|uniref:YhdP family protein n=1 Tax=Kordiimonas marina TaxID=2872312 RepID=UPI001FF6A66D|nr:AsmA-like C-terminal domain-containing protein [Kordiimonas marina]MCJ9428957.1 AsmA-like C-terminal domain-containing protein [Kordiimonas marina]
MAPVDVSFARTLVEARAADVLPGWRISFKDAIVGWDWRSVRPWVSITDLKLIDRRDRLRANVQDVRLGMAFTSLLSNVSFSTIDVSNANITISDLAGFSDATDNGKQGTPRKLFGESGIPRPELLRPVTEAFSRFGSRLLKTAPGLDRILIKNTSVDIYRGEGLQDAHLDLPTFRLSNNHNELELRSLIDARFADVPTQIRLTGTAEPTYGEMKLSLSMSGLMPSSLAETAKLPEVVSALQFPIGLDIDLELGANVGLRGARFAITIDDGILSDPVMFPKPAPIRYGTISGDYDVAEQVIAIKQVEIAAGDHLITGHGLVYWDEGNPHPGIKLDLGIDGEVPLSDVLMYWPIHTYPDGTPRGARAWVDQHMIKGMTNDAEFQVDMRPDGTGPFENKSIIKLGFGFHDLDTHFLLTMPPIKGARGHAALTHTSFRLWLEGGTVLEMPLKDSRVDIEHINIHEGAIGNFTVHTAGDVPTVMKLISYPPLSVPEKMHFDAARIGGEATIRALITLPLIKDLPDDAIHYDVQAELAHASVADLLGGEGLKDASLTLSLDRDTLAVGGNGILNGVPLNLHWREDMAAGRASPDADTSQIVLTGNMDQNDLKALGVDISDFLDGKAWGEATFVGRSLKFRKGYFSADTLGAVVMAPQLGWKKPADAPANITGTVIFDDKGTHLHPLVATGENIDVKADFDWGPKDSGLFKGRFDLRKLGRTEGLVGTVEEKPGKPTVAKLKAKDFDLAPLLVAGSDKKQNNGTKDVDLSLDANRLLLENGEYLKGATVRARFRDGSPKLASFTGTFPVKEGQKPVPTTMAIREDGGQDQAITIESPDGGRFLRGLGLFAHLSGGTLKMEGRTTGWGGTLHLKGNGTILGANLVSKESLGPAVTEGVVSGLDHYLKDGPIELNNITIPFAYNEGLLDLNELKANGPSMGMTMEGQIEAKTGRINVNGVIVPAYGINSLLGKIPLVGGLFSGGEGKGLFGVAYRVKGLTEKPDVSVNALSGLAPGFLRLLFEGRKGKVSDVKEPPQTPEKAAEQTDKATQPASEVEKPASPQPSPAVKPDAKPETKPETKPDGTPEKTAPAPEKTPATPDQEPAKAPDQAPVPAPEKAPTKSPDTAPAKDPAQSPSVTPATVPSPA